MKAENILLGSDGLWKLCDFGSTSTNHKRFERPEEMGIEEDNIRKHTTPAYRSPEVCLLKIINNQIFLFDSFATFVLVSDVGFASERSYK